MEDNQKLKEEISDLKNQIHDLEKDLIHDSLTSLKTRSFFEEETRIYLSEIVKNNEGKRKDWFGFKNLSFLFFDIDHFKNVNDTYGHEIGDQVLKEVGHVIVKSVREGDTVARWGGEEIIASLLGANESDAKQKAESIRRKIESLTFDTVPNLKITISIGVANSLPGATYETILKNADLALYRAKATGRNKVVASSDLSE